MKKGAYDKNHTKKLMEEIINKRIRDFSKTTDIIQTILIFLIALLVPTFLALLLNKVFGAESFIAQHSQLVVGTIVNTALIVTAINLKGWAKILGVVTMPSISTVLGGYVFGTASPYMVYMIPAIWVGNFVLVYSYKFLMLSREKNYFLAGVVGVIVKVVIIGGIFMLLNSVFNIFPEKIASTLQTAMTSVQLITATLGVIVSYFIYLPEKSSKIKE